MIKTVATIIEAILILIVLWLVIVFLAMAVYFDPECHAYGYDKALYQAPFEFYCVKTDDVIVPLPEIYNE